MIQANEWICGHKHLLAQQTASYQSDDSWTMLSDRLFSNISFDKLVQARHNL